jgi:hypothetical protein
LIEACLYCVITDEAVVPDTLQNFLFWNHATFVRAEEDQQFHQQWLKAKLSLR